MITVLMNLKPYHITNISTATEPRQTKKTLQLVLANYIIASRQLLKHMYTQRGHNTERTSLLLKMECIHP